MTKIVATSSLNTTEIQRDILLTISVLGLILFFWFINKKFLKKDLDIIPGGIYYAFCIYLGRESLFGLAFGSLFALSLYFCHTRLLELLSMTKVMYNSNKENNSDSINSGFRGGVEDNDIYKGGGGGIGGSL